MERKEVIEEIRELLDNNQQDNRYLMEEFFNLLFWKDYGMGYLEVEDKHNIFSEIKKATKVNDYDGQESVRLDIDKILPFVNKIRKQIGLKELTDKMFSGVMEITDEVRKELILKEL